MKFTNSVIVGCALAAPIAALPARNSNGGPDNSSQATPTGRLAARQANEINALLSAVPAVETALGLAKRNPQDIVIVSGSSTSTLNFSGATVTPTTIVLGKRQAGVTISGLSGSALSALGTATGSAGSVLSALATATPTVSVGRRQVAISGSAIGSLLSGSGVGTIAVSGVATPSVSLARRQQGGASTPVSSSDISAIEGVLGDLLGGVVKRQSSGQGSQGGNSQGSGSSGSSSSSSGSEVIAGATLDGYTLQLLDKRQNGGNGQGGNGQGGNGQSGNGQSGNGQSGNGQSGNGQSGNGQSSNGQQSGNGQSSNGQSGSNSSGSSSSGSSSSSTTQTEADILNDILKLITKRAVSLEARQFNTSQIPGNLTNTTITISTK